MIIKKPTIHSMNRRSYYCDYSRPGIYHITLKVAEALRHPFGKVVGDMNKPDGDPDAPHVELTPIGQMVEQELLHSISAHYPMMEVQDYVIMPEHMHFIIKAHRPIVSKNGHKMNLGQVMAGYKKGCNKKYWELTGQGETQQGKPTGTEPAGTERSAVHPQKKRTPSWGTTGRQPLFSEGFTDVIPLSEEALEQKRAYIKGNPRSRLLRTSNRAWLQTQRGGIDTALTLSDLRSYLHHVCAPQQRTPEALAAIEERLLMAGEKKRSEGTAAHDAPTICCDSYGNRELLSQRCLPVVCHRKYKEQLEKQKQCCLDAAKQGAVLVSARIAPGEQLIIDEAVNQGMPVILVADNGFPEVYHPSAERIKQCASGQLLYVSPWTYRYRLKDEGITVAECKTMNCVALALCKTSDDWWMDKGARR